MKGSKDPKFVPEAGPPNVFKERLEGLNIGATVVELPSSEALGENRLLRIDITDAEKWGSEEGARKLVPFFGELAWQAFRKERKEEFEITNAVHQKEAIEDMDKANFSETDHIYVINDGERAIAFLAVEDIELEDDEKSCLVSLSVVHQERRNEGINKELYRCIFSSGEYETVLGCSNTPSAVKARLQMGDEYGYTGYYCGWKNGWYGEHGTEEQEERVGKISRDIQEIYAESGTTIPLEDMPKHTVVAREDVVPIPPLKETDINFGPGDAGLDGTFRNWFLPMQEKNLPNTTYGILLNIRGS